MAAVVRRAAAIGIALVVVLALIGSVAERVVRLAPCPVLTVHSDRTVFKQPYRAYLPEMPTQIPA